MHHAEAKALETRHVEYSPELWAALRHTFSEGRQKYYLDRAWEDAKGAFELHQWNTQLSESLYVVLQGFQIVLRNRLDREITKYYKGRFGETKSYEDRDVAEWRKLWCFTLNPGEKDTCTDVWSQIRQAKKKLKDDEVKKPATTTFKEPGPHDNFVAAANFGLWVQLLHEQYGNTLWSGVLRKAFPNSTDRDHLYRVADRARDVRNSIMHYEPIFEKHLPELHEKILEYMHSWCPETADMVARMSRFKDVWDDSPNCWRELQSLPPSL